MSQLWPGQNAPPMLSGKMRRVATDVLNRGWLPERTKVAIGAPCEFSLHPRWPPGAFRTAQMVKGRS